MTELNKKMLKLSGITEKSNVLDLGCGNGNFSFFINEQTGARITGVDLSDTRIENAKKVLSKKSDEIIMNGKLYRHPYFEIVTPVILRILKRIIIEKNAKKENFTGISGTTPCYLFENVKIQLVREDL